jgi:hypothetical protein
MYGVVDDNSNYYRSIIMDVIGMNQGNANEFLTVDK